MQVNLILCDAAQAVDGKLYVLGGGWTTVRVAPGDPVNMGLGAIVAVDWNETNQQIDVKVELQHEDGPTVVLAEQPIIMGALLEVGRPPGAKPGSPINAAIAFPLIPLPLEAGGYVWVVSIDGEPHARCPFQVTH